MRSALFDLDGTLLDTAPDFYRIICELAQLYQQPTPSFLEIRQLASNGGRAMLSQAFGEQFALNEESWLGEFLSRYRESPVQDGTLFDGFNEALEWLENQQIPWGIVTNKPRTMTDKVLEQLGLTERCSVSICPDEVRLAKPDPEGILLAIEKVSASTSQTLYFGDHIRDIEAGRQAGVKTVACNFGYLAEDEDSASWNADFTLEKSADLKTFLIQYFDQQGSADV
jgi:2-phosphoglycolate phosphatase